MNKHDLIKLIYQIPFFDEYGRSELTVIMGAALVLHGIKENTSDLDLSCSVIFFNKLISLGFKKKKSHSGLDKIEWKSISIYCNWVVEKRSFIDGILVADLSCVVSDKLKLGRKKDFYDLELISSKHKNDSMQTCYYEVFSYPNCLRGFLHIGKLKSPIILIHGYFSSNKIGPHRLYFQIAQALNLLGYTVLRIDLSAMGESDGKIEEVVFNKHVSDLFITVNSLLTSTGADKVHLIGHCAGCFNILHTLVLSNKIASVTLLSPFLATEQAFINLLGENNYKHLLTENYTYRNGLFCHKSFIDAAFCLFDTEIIKILHQIDNCIYISASDELSSSSDLVSWAKDNDLKFVLVDDANHNYLSQMSRNILIDSLISRFINIKKRES